MKKDFFISNEGNRKKKVEMYLALGEVLQLLNIDLNFPQNLPQNYDEEYSILYKWFKSNFDRVMQITERDLETISNNPTEEFKAMSKFFNHELSWIIDDKSRKILNSAFKKIDEDSKLLVYALMKLDLNTAKVEELSTDKYEMDDNDFESSKLKSNQDEFIKYLKSIVSLYSDIYSLKKRYKHLMAIKKDCLMKSIDEYINAKNNEKTEILNQNLEVYYQLDSCYQDYNKYLNDETTNSPYSSKIKSIDYEQQYIVDCIEKNLQLQSKLYSYNIIYGKYRNYIAMASFIDYFLSGRCNSLEGSNGAYNLYEQESRADIVINKLDVIIDSLEKIKENQYYIYNELNNINNSLNVINYQLLVNNLLQTVQISELSQIIDNTEEIAYNTKVTAYYAKKTANYTKAIAIMQFLDRL